MTPNLRRLLFETLYRNQYLYRFASTVPFAGQWRQWQRQVLPHLRGHDVLELGCGLGDLLADMLALGYSCYAVEASPQMVAAARATLRKRHAGSPGLVKQGSARALPFSDGSFDCVVSTFPSEYICDLNVINEVRRVLRPGGRLIVIGSASLLPVGFFHPFLLFLHALVYGFGPRRKGQRANRARPQSPLRNPASGGRLYPQDGITREPVADTSFGRLIPLERAGLKRRTEIARSPRWEVAIIFGEKD